MIMFSINGNDFSNRVVAENYKVQSNRVEQTWVDGNQTKHWVWVGKKTTISGTFEMQFLNEEEYDDFRRILDRETGDDCLTLCTLCDNKTNKEVTTKVHISFNLSRGRTDLWEDYFERITVNVEGK